MQLHKPAAGEGGLKTLALNWPHATLVSAPCSQHGFGGRFVSAVPWAIGLHHRKSPLTSKKSYLAPRHQPGNRLQSTYSIAITDISSLRFFLYSHKFLSGCNPWSTATFLKILALLTLHQIKSCLCHPVFCNAFFLQSESLYISTKTKQCPLVVRALCPRQKAHFRTNGGLSEKICAIQLHSSEINF